MFSKGGTKNAPYLTGLQYHTYVDDNNPAKVAEGAEGGKKVFSQRCKHFDSEKKEGVDARLMMNLYAGATATNTMTGCYLTWESTIGRD